MAVRMGSFRHSLLEKRERLLSVKGYSELRFADIDSSEEDDPVRCCSYRFISDKITSFLRNVQDVATNAWHMGISDPRKIMFSAKMGLALVLVSLVIFWKESPKEMSRYSVWAILTVVVVFEFSIGKMVLDKSCFLFGIIY